MSDLPATITVDSGTILAAVAVVYGGMAAAIGYLWKARNEDSRFLRESLLQALGGSTHREKVYHWFLTRLHPDLVAEAERDLGDLTRVDPNQTGSLPAARPGEASRKRPAHRSGEHRVAMVLFGLLNWLGLGAAGIGMTCLLVGLL